MSFDTSKRKSHDQTRDSRVSIVMITPNRGSQILTALEHLLKLPERPPIVVVDNGSADTTADIAGAIGDSVEVLLLNENLGGAGRNIGVAKAETPYVALSDDDSWWAPGALQRAANLLDSTPDLGLIAAKILVGPEPRLDPLCHVMANSGLGDRADTCTVGVPIVGFAACGAIVRRESFLQAGGFEQRLGVGGEEYILALDLLRNG